MTYSDSELNRAVLQEIINSHRFFEAWFSGQCEGGDAYFSKHLLSRIAPDFHIVMPGGKLMSGKSLLGDIRKAYGTNPQFKIEIRNVVGRRLDKIGVLMLATYEEWQKNALNSKPANNARLSSALFRRDPSVPNGFLWVHVHETWLPEAVVSVDRFDF
ncbi:MAG: hypothetical protein ACE5K1_03330 [Acidiferrobacterales bacterium]